METNQWDKVITSDKVNRSLGIKEAWSHRELIGLFVKRDYAVAIKQTALGALWILIQPIANSLANLIVFGGLAGLSTDGVPQMLFYYVGTMLWAIFTGVITAESEIFITNANIFGKVYFPRLTVVIANALSTLVKTMIQFVLFAFMYIYVLIFGNGLHPSWKILLVFPIMLWIAIIGMGMGMIISSITTKYRDLKTMLPFVLPIIMYATPVVYPLSQMPKKYRIFIELNPLSAPIESFRIVCFDAGFVPWYSYLCSIIVTCVCFLIGLILFNKTDKNFVDVV